MMKPGRRKTLMLTVLAVVVAGFAVNACNNSSGSKVDTTRPAGSGASAGGAMAGPPPDKGMKGVPGDNPVDTRNYMLSVGWGDNLPDTQIVQTYFSWGSDSSLIRIVPNVDAENIDWAAATSPTGDNPGHFVARIYNLENKNIPPLGLGGLGTGLLWVGQVDKNGARGIGVYSFKNNGDLEKKPKVFASQYVFCGGQHDYPKVELTDGHKCPSTAVKKNASTKVQYLLASLQPLSRDSSPNPGTGLWISCSGGCCELQSLQ